MPRVAQDAAAAAVTPVPSGLLQVVLDDGAAAVVGVAVPQLSGRSLAGALR